MRKSLAVLLVPAAVVGGLSVGIRVAAAHECPEGEPPDSEQCEDTPVYDDYRPNYVPLFDLAGREYGDPSAAPDERHDAQRWRDECADDGRESQFCHWVYGGTSARDYGESDDGRSDDPEDELLPRPNEVHAGFGANHCFAAEAAHDCDRHDQGEFGTHDSHGGAIYVDVCLSANPDSRWCDDGLEDTQAGVTIVDHLSCPVGCSDEYHVVRPLDTEYTAEQMADSGEAIEAIAADPVRHVCGYEASSSC